MLFGTQVRLPNGRMGIVVANRDGESDVFTGRRSDRSPIVDTFLDCELAATGSVYLTLAQLVRDELRDAKSKGNWSALVVTGL